MLQGDFGGIFDAFLCISMRFYVFQCVFKRFLRLNRVLGRFLGSQMAFTRNSGGFQGAFKVTTRLKELHKLSGDLYRSFMGFQKRYNAFHGVSERLRIFERDLVDFIGSQVTFPGVQKSFRGVTLR